MLNKLAIDALNNEDILLNILRAHRLPEPRISRPSGRPSSPSTLICDTTAQTLRTDDSLELDPPLRVDIHRCIQNVLPSLNFNEYQGNSWAELVRVMDWASRRAQAIARTPL